MEAKFSKEPLPAKCEWLVLAEVQTPMSESTLSEVDLLPVELRCLLLCGGVKSSSVAFLFKDCDFVLWAKHKGTGFKLKTKYSKYRTNFRNVRNLKHKLC